MDDDDIETGLDERGNAFAHVFRRPAGAPALPSPSPEQEEPGTFAAPELYTRWALIRKDPTVSQRGWIHAQRLPAEWRYSEELSALSTIDPAPRPPGWKLSPKAVRAFILGMRALPEDWALPSIPITQKFYGDMELVDRAIVTLAGNRSLMLIGETGAAKSLLSELLAAAISGDSTLVIQGSAGTTEEHVRYAWNYPILMRDGASLESLIPSPIYRGMQRGQIVRFEELTRCPPEIQDQLISILSERHLQIPELSDGLLLAKRGFAVIATANLHDTGIHPMSSALKRRFAFETVPMIEDQEQEATLVKRQVFALMERDGYPTQIHDGVLRLLITVINELRTGRTEDGGRITRPTTRLSTAEAVAVAHAAALDAVHLGDGTMTPAGVARHLYSVVLQDEPRNRRAIEDYVERVATRRADGNPLWAGFAQACATLLETRRDG